ncbi:MAG TPA: hypothetical protein VGC13_31335 [Longimicrobium sp.]|jgi:hypothetical protein|uniref:hypothetical protein n=1 Tax=Longimicrobium sp. TaxID=2029185 RepID=UPI002ED78644
MNNLRGRRVQIAGSASPETAVERLGYAHELVAAVVRGILRQGGGIVVGTGKEPRAVGAAAGAPALTFDWTALETAAECLRADESLYPEAAGAPVVVISSEKAEHEIPEARRPLWEELLASGRMRVESIRAGSRSAALIRQRQAEFSDVLLVLGGGTGVEHSAELFLERQRSVLPLDLPLGSSRGDGTGGAERLAKEVRADAARFLRLDSTVADLATTRFSGLGTRLGTASSSVIAERVVSLLCELELPRAFYVRLLNPDHPQFPQVEAFFRNVVDPVIRAAGYQRIEIGTDRAEHPFMNVDIFHNLHHAPLAIVDVTGSRPNCFIELGYALGRAARVLVTAENGTSLPFDQQAIPCLFWSATEVDERRREQLVEFWRKYVDRPPLVR